MRSGHLSWSLFLCSISLFLVGVAAAGDSLYRWTDDQGVVHFSDRAPATSDRPVETLSMPESAASASTDDDTYSVIKQVERMQAERRRRAHERRKAYLQDLDERRRLAEVAAAEARARQFEAELQGARETIYIRPWAWPLYPSPPHLHHRPPSASSAQPQSPRSQMSLRRPGRSIKPVAPQVPQH